MATIQFIVGIDETSIPKVQLTRSRDGNTGTATFRFEQPDILKSSMQDKGDITAMYLKDEEGTLFTKYVNAKFINGKPKAVESIYIIKSPNNWDRFMRFMDRYAKVKGLTFTKTPH